MNLMNATLLFCVLFASSVEAQKVVDAEMQAKVLLQSLTGLTPNKKDIDQVSKIISDQGKLKAGLYITQTYPQFYTVTLKDFFSPDTNEDKSLAIPLNDMSAALIGVVRDEIPFPEAFYEDIYYAGQSIDPNESYRKERNNFKKADGASGDYIKIGEYYVRKLFGGNNNRHYDDLEKYKIDISNPLVFRRIGQRSGQLPIPEEGISGIISTRTFGEAYFNAGTNRAALAGIMDRFMCHTMEQLHDTTVPDLRVRRDVTREPSGDSEVFKARCVGCHAGMDALSGAFAFYDYLEGKNQYTHGEVAQKYATNDVVSPESGHVTTSDSWMNLWNSGINAKFEWPQGQEEGNGVRSLMKMVTHSKGFARCMSQRVFEKVCRRSPETSREKENVELEAENFMLGKYNLKHSFVRHSAACSEL